MLSRRAQLLKPSPTLAISAKEKALKAQGLDVIGFGAGEPDFDTPVHIKEAAIHAINDGFTKYTPVGGIDPLKDVIIEKFRKDNGITFARDEIIVSCGGKHSLYNLFQALFDEGDEVIIPSPFWVSYPPMVELAGATPVCIETYENEDYQLTRAALEKVITPRTKAIVLNYPSNPVGSVFSLDNLTEIGKLCVEKGIYIISDEIYEKLVYGSHRHTSIASIDPAIKERTIIAHGISKTYSMTGWRIGFTAGPKKIIQAMTNIQSQSTSNPTSISQKAAIAALSGPQDFIASMVTEFDKRRAFLLQALREIDGVTCYDPKGAFYVFPNFTSVIGKSYEGKKIDGIGDFAQILLDHFLVAVVPGAEFGKEGYLRLSFATSMENIQRGIERIQKAARALR